LANSCPGVNCGSVLAGMQFIHATRAAGLIFSVGLSLYAQTAPVPDAPAEIRGLPPRVSPTDYQSQAKVGPVTVGAEFTGHGVPTREGPLITENYVVVEVALFGSDGTKLRISAAEFSLRINGKKNSLTAVPYGMALASLKDPEWIPPEPPVSKSKSSVGGGGGEQEQSNEPPRPVKIPVPVQRAMALRVQKSALPEGDRVLPQAGLLFFDYRGKTENLQSVELMYDGPAGKATLKLHP
jgi:hypothetical protein